MLLPHSVLFAGSGSEELRAAEQGVRSTGLAEGAFQVAGVAEATAALSLYPALVVLLPGASLDLLQHIKTSPEHRHVPVVVIASAPEYAESAWDAMANCVILSPAGDLDRVCAEVIRFWLQSAMLPCGDGGKPAHNGRRAA